MVNGIRICKKTVFQYLTVITLTAAVLFIVYRLWEVNIWEIPFEYSGDGLSGLAFTKLMMEEGGLGFTSDRLGAPFGYASYDASQSSYLTLILKKLVSVFSKNPVFVVNFSFLASFVIIACITLAVLKGLDIEEHAAVVFAVLYACAPYHFNRGESHFSLAFYAAVPIAVYYAVKMMQGDVLKNQKWQGWLNYILGMAVIGISGVYYAFFACFFFCAAAVYILMNEKSRTRLKEVLASIFLITGTVFIGYLPTIGYWMEHGRNEGGIVRTAEGIEVYGLKISQLLMPLTGHRISWLADWKDQFNQNYAVNENDTSTLGLIGAAGFVVLLLVVWKKERGNQSSCLHELACLNLAAVLYAAVGGLMNIQGLYLIMLRCGNRISIFIAFFSCICAAILVSGFLEKRNLQKKAVGGMLLCLLAVGIFDGTRSSYFDAEDISARTASDREFITQVEETESGEGMILQLPVMYYPENGSIHQMQDYAPLTGYLYSDSLRWSYGTFRGRPGSRLLDEFRSEDLSAKDMVCMAAEMGYTGIYIDRLGYEEADYEQLKHCLQILLNQEPLQSPHADKLYFSLKDYIEQNNIEQNYCSTEFQDGIYEQEQNEEKEWRWVSRESRFQIYNWSLKAQKVRITLQIEPSWEGDYTLHIDGQEESEFHLHPHEVNECCVETELKSGFNSFEMHTQAPLLEVPEDKRELCYMLTGYELERMDGIVTVNTEGENSNTESEGWSLYD